MNIQCIHCGEPWDYYGVTHGDMLPWEAKLFMQGAGCPICEGEVDNEHKFEPTSVNDIEYGDLDPMIRLNQLDDRDDNKSVKWERPKDKVFWECDCCGVQVIGNIDYQEEHEDYVDYLIPCKSKAQQWWSSHPFERHGAPDVKPAHTFVLNETLQWIEYGRGHAAIFEYAPSKVMNVCEFCLQYCDHCGGPIVPAMDHNDPYAAGYCGN